MKMLQKIHKPISRNIHSTNRRQNIPTPTVRFFWKLKVWTLMAKAHINRQLRGPVKNRKEIQERSTSEGIIVNFMIDVYDLHNMQIKS